MDALVVPPGLELAVLDLLVGHGELVLLGHLPALVDQLVLVGAHGLDLHATKDKSENIVMDEEY